MATTFDRTKFKSVLHYILHETTTNDRVFKTHIWKILYFSDFNFYEKNSKLITGEIYSKLPNGPTPRHFDEIIRSLKDEGAIQEKKVTIGSKIGNKFISLKEPKFNLTSDELSEIDNAIKLCSSMTTTQISLFSHEDTPWKVAKDKRDLNPEHVFYRTPMFSVTEEN